MYFKVKTWSTQSRRVGYFAFAEGLTTDGEKVLLNLSKWPDDCGCNPYHFEIAHKFPDNYYSRGHEFASKEEAEHAFKYAGLSYKVKSVDKDTLEIISLYIIDEHKEF